MANPWLARQRKAELVELAQAVGLKDVDSKRKADLEIAIDEVLSDNAARYQSDPRFTDYFKSRARAGGSPVKRERESAAATGAAAGDVKPSRRKSTKPIEEPVAATESEESESPTDPSAAPSDTPSMALTRTPARAFALAARLTNSLPATPADVAQAVDRSTVAVRSQLSSLVGPASPVATSLTDAAHTTRAWLSTVHAVLSAAALFEAYHLRRELLPDVYAFTIPAISWLGTGDKPVHVPDVFALLTSGFWACTATWLLTSLIIPGVAGWFFNLSSATGTAPVRVPASAPAKRSRGRPSGASQKREGVDKNQEEEQEEEGGEGMSEGKQQKQEYAVDPLMFSVAKALITYVVYAQGVTFGGLLSPWAVTRVEAALYSGWRGVLVGTGVTALAAVWEAVSRK